MLPKARSDLEPDGSLEGLDDIDGIVDDEWCKSVLEIMDKEGKVVVKKGGKGSGDFGHSGRPGLVGGSSGGEGMPSKMPEGKKNWYRAMAKKDFGYEGKIDFLANNPGEETRMGLYDEETNTVYIYDNAEKLGKGSSALKHEITHAKWDEVEDALAEDRKGVQEYLKFVGNNEDEIYEACSSLKLTPYIEYVWDHNRYEGDSNQSLNETFAEFGRLTMSRTDGLGWLAGQIGKDSLPYQAYSKFLEAYANLHK